MCFPCRTLLIVALSFFGLGSVGLRAASDEPKEVRLDFEHVDIQENGAALTIPGLTVPFGSIAIGDETAAGGTHALVLLPSKPLGQVRIALPADLPVCYVELFIRAVPSEVGTDEVGFDIGGAMGELIRVDGEGRVYVRNGPGDDWRGTSARWTDAGGGARWLRLNLRLDRIRGKWDLYADGRHVATNMGLAAAASSAIMIHGNLLTPVLIDSIYAGPADPLLTQSQGGSSTGKPRDSLVVLETAANKSADAAESGQAGNATGAKSEGPEGKKNSQDQPARTSRLKVFTRSQ